VGDPALPAISPDSSPNSSPNQCSAEPVSTPGSVVVVFELVAHGQDRHCRRLLDLEQRYVAALAEWDEQLAQERIVVGLAIDER
jgi:hypothetical protein